MKRAIYACDVGSIRQGNFAWTRIDPSNQEKPDGDGDIARLCSRLISDLMNNVSVALGFEAPLFLPVPDSADNLSQGRSNEGNRSCFAPAGAYVATLALHQTAWIFKRLHDARLNFHSTFDWHLWQSNNTVPVLLCWEAFISGKHKGPSHKKDSEKAAKLFLKFEGKLVTPEDDVTAERPLSLVAAAALWAGICQKPDLICCDCLVLKPS